MFFTVERADVADERKEYLEFLSQLFESKVCDPVIAKVYPVKQVPEAHKYVDSGRKKGNVVLKIA
ncbi:zinc-binding dehydrogenase [Phaeodactylibacter xiamenensis]|uniref:Enoyl reductase (ER) domain-containing protein n=1 Tax=Phaeodactylibacter xiamenensis TaxID=1524460 RepID=A0A098S929_9BACT|nr:zinc-binding dehydrogenase [Phaeodactylibacter xiamenensis]KGE88615.1 hypothetical protein IX84_08050 [Phaeodactylibacter xiamenensis]MCR9051401.1 zinc-binding dehydrogenase [bacterium]